MRCTDTAIAREVGPLRTREAWPSKNGSPYGPRSGSRVPGARPDRLGPGRHHPRGSAGGRGGRSAMEVELPFPGKDGVLGTVNARQIGDNNPFGFNPGDTFGKDDVLMDDSAVHVPLGRPIKTVLRSKKTSSMISSCRSSAPRSYGARDGHHSGSRRPNRNIRDSLRGTLRRRPLRHARHQIVDIRPHSIRGSITQPTFASAAERKVSTEL